MREQKVLDSWKEISAYLRRSIRTCQRWQAELGLPVHRLDPTPKARVFAYKDELDAWMKEKQHLLVEMPSVAVLPLQNLSGDPEQEYFAEGCAFWLS